MSATVTQLYPAMPGRPDMATTGFRDGRDAPPAHGRARGMAIGYARVSTEDQKLDLQRDALTAAGVAPSYIYEEQVSGVKAHRPALEACLKALREGDTLVVWKLDRLGRSLPELIRIADDLAARGVELRSLTEGIDTTTPGGRLVYNIFGAVAQFEHDLVVERTRAGLKAARLRGHKGGRPRKINDGKWKVARALMDDPAIVFDEIARAIGVSRSALYRERKRREDLAKAKALAAGPPDDTQ